MTSEHMNWLLPYKSFQSGLPRPSYPNSGSVKYLVGQVGSPRKERDLLRSHSSI